MYHFLEIKIAQFGVDIFGQLVQGVFACAFIFINHMILCFATSFTFSFTSLSAVLPTHFCCDDIYDCSYNVHSRSPRGLTFTWWGCCGLCFWHTPTELAHSFLFSSCVYFCLYGPFNCISFYKFSRQLFAFSLLFFRSHFCLIGPLWLLQLYFIP